MASSKLNDFLKALPSNIITLKVKASIYMNFREHTIQSMKHHFFSLFTKPHIIITES